jgi:hypothetical protein
LKIKPILINILSALIYKSTTKLNFTKKILNKAADQPSKYFFELSSSADELIKTLDDLSKAADELIKIFY